MRWDTLSELEQEHVKQLIRSRLKSFVKKVEDIRIYGTCLYLYVAIDIQSYQRKKYKNNSIAKRLNHLNLSSVGCVYSSYYNEEYHKWEIYLETKEELKRKIELLESIQTEFSGEMERERKHMTKMMTRLIFPLNLSV